MKLTINYPNLENYDWTNKTVDTYDHLNQFSGLISQDVLDLCWSFEDAIINDRITGEEKEDFETICKDVYSGMALSSAELEQRFKAVNLATELICMVQDKIKAAKEAAPSPKGKARSVTVKTNTQEEGFYSPENFGMFTNNF